MGEESDGSLVEEGGGTVKGEKAMPQHPDELRLLHALLKAPRST